VQAHTTKWIQLASSGPSARGSAQGLAVRGLGSGAPRYLDCSYRPLLHCSFSIHPNILQVSPSPPRTNHILTIDFGRSIHQTCGVDALSPFGIPRSSSGSQSATLTRDLGLLQDQDSSSLLVITTCILLKSGKNPGSMVLLLRTRVRCIELFLSGHIVRMVKSCLWGQPQDRLTSVECILRMWSKHRPLETIANKDGSALSIFACGALHRPILRFSRSSSSQHSYKHASLSALDYIFSKATTIQPSVRRT
jgi:hypothetical protein